VKTITPTLNDACLFIVDCLHATAPIEQDGYPLIRTPNIGKGRLDLNGVFRVSQDTYDVWTRRAIPQDNDLILAREAPAGNVAIVKNGDRVCLGQRTVLLRPDPSKVDPDFLCYYLLAPKQQGLLLRGAKGATAAHVNMNDIRSLPLEDIPDRPTQECVGNTLATYDDLIENNARRMALLETSVRLLYQEWFVRLRFPGHEHSRITKGIPQGWERKTAHEALQILSGGTPKTSVPEFWGGEIPFYTPKDAPDGVWVTDCERTITDAGLGNCNSRLFPKETVFISARGTVGKLNMAQRPMAMSQSCYALVGNSHLTQPFVFCAMQQGLDALRQQAVGAVFDAIIVDTFKRIFLLVPETTIVRLFDEVARRALAQLENLMLQNLKLRTARDLLLPRLLNGDMKV